MVARKAKGYADSINAARSGGFDAGRLGDHIPGHHTRDNIAEWYWKGGAGEMTDEIGWEIWQSWLAGFDAGMDCGR